MKLNDGIRLDFYQDEVMNKRLLHDISLKLISTTIKHNLWKITYSYKTKRGNKKENHKYVISKDSSDARLDFINYINEFNSNNQYRVLSNVKILDVQYTGTLEQSY